MPYFIQNTFSSWRLLWHHFKPICCRLSSTSPHVFPFPNLCAIFRYVSFPSLGRAAPEISIDDNSTCDNPCPSKNPNSTPPCGKAVTNCAAAWIPASIKTLCSSCFLSNLSATDKLFVEDERFFLLIDLSTVGESLLPAVNFVLPLPWEKQ